MGARSFDSALMTKSTSSIRCESGDAVDAVAPTRAMAAVRRRRARSCSRQMLAAMPKSHARKEPRSGSKRGHRATARAKTSDATSSARSGPERAYANRRSDS